MKTIYKILIFSLLLTSCKTTFVFTLGDLFLYFGLVFIFFIVLYIVLKYLMIKYLND
jgi:hypothetical protein